MNPFETREIGRTGLEVTRLGLGGASLGNMYKVVDEEEAGKTIQEAFDNGIRFFDTAPMYGFGKSERLMGQVLRNLPRDSFVLATKVGRLIVDGPPTAETEETPFVEITDVHPVFDYSREGILRSLEESRRRLGFERIDIVHIHDPDVAGAYAQALDEAFPTLAELRSQGLIKAVGVGLNQAEMLCDFARNADFDCFLLAGRYTLLDQIALQELLPLCQEKRISIVIGGAYNSGILATGAVPGARYNYAPAPPEIMDKTRRLAAVCAEYQIPLKAAALQFPFGHPAVAANIPGTTTRERLKENLALLQYPIPLEFWLELKRRDLIAQEAPLPGA